MPGWSNSFLMPYCMNSFSGAVYKTFQQNHTGPYDFLPRYTMTWRDSASLDGTDSLPEVSIAALPALGGTVVFRQDPPPLSEFVQLSA